METWQRLLKTEWAGRPEAICKETMPSTNTCLKEAAKQGAPAGTVCLAQAQTAGKGRLGRSWFSPPGRGLWVSVLARPQMPLERWPHLTLAAALAMAKAVENQGLAPQIKWPNDLVLQGKKVCGVLLEMGPGFVVIGTWLNLRPGSYQEELQDKAGSLEEISGRPMAGDAILADYLYHLEKALQALEQRGLAGIRDEYEKRSCTLGRDVVVSGGMDARGRAEALDEDGALILKLANGDTCRVLAGDVSVRGVMGYAE
ncbi:MAG: biotin--[Clostridia bacterium]|nr:biotin--[acetyl-CoA-carboxylase] ligase [Clostridia bacterium]